MKKKIIILGIVAAALLGGVFLFFVGKRYDIAVTQDQIDSALTKNFPVTKNYFMIFGITYSNPQVTLLDKDDRIQVGLDATLNIRINGESKELGGGVTVSSGIRYEPTTWEFFLDDAEIERFEIQGVPEEWLDRITTFASTAAKDFVETKPVYRLEAKDVKTATAKLLLKGFEVRDQVVYVTLGI